VLAGTGTVGSVTVASGGTISPGNSPGILTSSALALNAGAATTIELGGTTRGNQYDALVVVGNLNLGGTLTVSLINGFSPATGNTFDLLDWGTLAGTFNTLQLADLDGRIAWDTSHLYDSGASGGTIAVQSTYYLGDVNRDSHVDVADISALETALSDLDQYKSTNSLTDLQLFNLVANVDGVGNVTNADIQALIILLANGGGGGSVTAVPEPASLILLVFAAPFVAFASRRNR
jgi:hypothetical protein